MISTKGIDLFLEDVRRQCKQYNIKLIMANSKTVFISENIRSCGYFDCINRELAVGIKREDWLQLLVHESCHVDQWLENCKAWKRESVVGNNVLDPWLTGKDFDLRRVKRALRNVIMLELDCEIRSINKIIEYDLPINLATYIQRVNAYLFYHHRVYQTRSWSPAVYESNILNYMPNKILPSHRYLVLSKKMRKHFIQAGF